MRILYLPNCYSQQRQREKKANIYPVRMAMEAEWYRKQGHYVVWDKGCAVYDCTGNCKKCNFIDTEFDKIITEPEGLPFLSLPHPDRVFTRAKSYTSGNYKHLPGTHIMSASGCWWGKCSFCVENKTRVEQLETHKTEFFSETGFTQGEWGTAILVKQPYEVRPVEDVINEIEECKALGFREVFDDSATFPTGRWLDEFITSLDRRNMLLHLGCNARIIGYPFRDMYRVGFRMLLFGIESANQKTLDKINKGVKVEDIIPTIRKAAEAGLELHTAVMFGYPWETDTDAIRTLKLVHYLLRKGYAKTAQASFYTVRNDRGNEQHKKYIPKIYNVAYSPEFWFNQLKDIRNTDDLKYLWRKIKAGLNG